MAFDKTHDRLTVWINKALKQKFEALANDRGISKTALINEAVADLLRKYMQR
jgi:predicted transcriptional regulator